jgi:hypothetical protein
MCKIPEWIHEHFYDSDNKMPRKEIEEKFYNLSPLQQLELLKYFHSGELYANRRYQKAYKHIFHIILTWVVSDRPSALQWWHWLEAQKQKQNDKCLEFPHRDAFVLEIWQNLNDPQKPHGAAKAQVEAMRTDWSYYQNYFFNWFMQRYNIPAAFEVFGVRAMPGHLYPGGYSAAIVAAVLFCWICFDVFGFGMCGWSCTLFIVIVIVGILFLESKIDKNIPYAYLIQVLTPRLGVMTGIGYLFLLSAKDLVQYIIKTDFQWWGQIIISSALILSVWVYLTQAIQRQVKPRISFRNAWKRSTNLMAAAVAYSAIGLHLSAPILTSPKLLAEKICYNTLDLLMMASLALAIGVVLQLVWEDKPVTEPL